MVHVTVSGSVAPSGTKQLYEVKAAGALRTGDGRRLPATPQKPLRADEPVKQNAELDPRG